MKLADKESFRILELKSWFNNRFARIDYDGIDPKTLLKRDILEQFAAWTSFLSESFCFRRWEVSTRNFWRLFASAQLSCTYINFVDIDVFDSKKIDVGNAFSKAIFTDLFFNCSFIDIEILCKIIEIIGKYESVRRNFRTLGVSFVNPLMSNYSGNLVI
jgi:hypothetical protein